MGIEGTQSDAKKSKGKQWEATGRDGIKGQQCENTAGEVQLRKQGEAKKGKAKQREAKASKVNHE